MMGYLSWGEAFCESNGSPGTLYKYKAEYSERTKDSVRIRLYVAVRLQYWSSYFSFRITHAAKVNGVIQTAEIKSDRHFWGHQWEGSFDGGGGLNWWAGSYDYDGSNWHGWYKVFDGVVPVAIDDTSVEIIPCITREPITGAGNPWGEDYPHGANDLDKNNWQGCSGVWRPFGDDAQIGSWAWRSPDEDGIFLNNRGKKPLLGGFAIPAYKRPDKVSGIAVKPKKIEVCYQESTNVIVSWSAAKGATSYKAWAIKNGKEKRYLGNTTALFMSVSPYKIFGKNELFDGDTVSFAVQSLDSRGIAAEENYISYQTHIEDIGWQSVKYNGQQSGTTGMDLQVEGLRVNLLTDRYGGNVLYKSHVGNDGWETSWKMDGQQSGTTGESKQIEAVMLRLSGEIGDKFDIVYRVHVGNIGWLNWVKNGAVSGTAGKGRAVQAIQIKLVAKSANELDWGCAKSDDVCYFEIASKAPTNAYVLGRKKEQNEILFRGESGNIYYSGMKDGSYRIERYELVRLSDGKKIKWARSAADEAANPATVAKNIIGVLQPNASEVWELRAYNSKNRAVYMNANREWYRFKIHYFGGILYAYSVADSKWREGIAYVYFDNKWHESCGVYAYDVKTDSWRTL